MSDMGPRRMDGFGGGRPAMGPQPAARPRPAGMPARPAAPQPMQRPTQRPMQQRPVAPQPGAYDRAGYAQGQRQASAARPAAEPAQKRGGLGWLAALVVGLLVIVGVASAIVALYVKYYK